MVSGVFAAETVQISLGVREQDPNTLALYTPGSFYMAGNPAGLGIEWFSLDVQTLVLDGTWQQFTFNIDPASISAASFTGDGLISADKGIFEHIRIKSNGYAHNITLWTDQVRLQYDPTGIPPPQNVLVSTFAGYADNLEVMFQEPGFSGSTSANLDLTGPNFSGIDNTVGYDDTHSVRAQFRFIDNALTRWLRYTTYLAPTTKPESNPVVAEVGGPGNMYVSSTLTFWMMGIPEPSTLLLLGVGALALFRRR
jgi:hypothetical protein